MYAARFSPTNRGSCSCGCCVDAVRIPDRRETPRTEPVLRLTGSRPTGSHGWSDCSTPGAGRSSPTRWAWARHSSPASSSPRHHRDRQRALVVCPAALKDTGDVAAVPCRVGLLPPGQGVCPTTSCASGRTDDRSGPHGELDEYALVVIDEAHNLRNPNRAAHRAAVMPWRAQLTRRTGAADRDAGQQHAARPPHARVYLIRTTRVRRDWASRRIRGYINGRAGQDPETLSPEHLFDLMDQVAVRRTRRFVKQQYVGETIERGGRQVAIRVPDAATSRRLDYDLDEPGRRLLDAVVYALEIPVGPAASRAVRDRQRDPDRLSLARYTSSAMPSTGRRSRHTRWRTPGCCESALLKRLESSPRSLWRTRLETLIAVPRGVSVRPRRRLGARRARR